MDLKNAFDIPDMNITEANYEEWLTKLNATNTQAVHMLNLTTCNLQTLLDQVLLHASK